MQKNFFLSPYIFLKAFKEVLFFFLPDDTNESLANEAQVDKGSFHVTNHALTDGESTCLSVKFSILTLQI